MSKAITSTIASIIVTIDIAIEALTILDNTSIINLTTLEPNLVISLNNIVWTYAIE